MIRHLYLLRHAQSADKQIGQADVLRELTPAGVKEALLIASFILQQKIPLDIIISSIAERAKSTANLISDAIKFDPEHILFREELYEASTRTFFEFIGQLDEGLQHVLCVAHNPAISYLAEYLTKAEIGDMVPGGMAIIKFNDASWRNLSQGTGELVRYVHPEMLIKS
jgi:phosphohistidine phosphatase